ncbi:MAG: hypothetical protein EBU70_10070 [Actinobacteria bacterium]|nr:hypothetical protein [Actinomycetota bacterium]
MTTTVRPLQYEPGDRMPRRYRVGTMGRVRVAYTLEQCWHRVPGGTAVAAIEVARAMPDVRPDVQLLGVSGRHGDDPAVDLDLSIDVAGLPGRGALLYESMLRLRQPRVERAWPGCDAVHCTTIIPFATSRPMVATVHDLAFLRHPGFFTRRGNDVFRRSLAAVRRRAALVLCSSSATLADCAEAGIPSSRLRLVPLGVRPASVADGGVEQARARLGLPSEYLLFVGRCKDIIIRGGMNISEVEIETLLLACPGVRDAAVVGAPDPVLGERVCACVVPAPGATLTVEGIARWLRDERHVAVYKLPQRLLLLDALPRNPVGKILKRELRQRLQQEAAAESPSPSAPSAA